MPAITAPPVIASAANFRDLGGIPSQCGKRVRAGLLYRSEAFDVLSAEDIAVLNARGISLLCDLRSDSEQKRNPNLWPKKNAATGLNLNISADLRASHSAITTLLTGNPDTNDAHQAMLTTYRLFPTAFVHSLPNFFLALSQEQLPAVFHCAAGKDRTGFVAALLLYVLNVSIEEIVKDYMLSNQHWRGQRATSAIENYLKALCDGPPHAAVVNTLCSVHPDYLAAAFDAIDEQFGSLEQYLEQLGLNQSCIHQLRMLCLE